MAQVDILGHNPRANIWAARTFADQSLPNNTWTKILFTHQIQPSGFPTYNIIHSLGSGDFTINEDGWYDISYSIALANSAAGNSREARLRINAIYCMQYAQLAIATSSNRQRLIRHSKIILLKNDVVSLHAFQNTGSSIWIYGENDRTYLKIWKLR